MDLPPENGDPHMITRRIWQLLSLRPCVRRRIVDLMRGDRTVSDHQFLPVRGDGLHNAARIAAAENMKLASDRGDSHGASRSRDVRKLVPPIALGDRRRTPKIAD